VKKSPGARQRTSGPTGKATTTNLDYHRHRLGTVGRLGDGLRFPEDGNGQRATRRLHHRVDPEGAAATEKNRWSPSKERIQQLVAKNLLAALCLIEHLRAGQTPPVAAPVGRVGVAGVPAAGILRRWPDHITPVATAHPYGVLPARPGLLDAEMEGREDFLELKFCPCRTERAGRVRCRSTTPAGERRGRNSRCVSKTCPTEWHTEAPTKP